MLKTRYFAYEWGVFGVFYISQFVLILTIINIIIAITAIVLERHNPASSIAWVMVIFMLPIVGIILYFLLSQNIAKRKIYKLSSFEEKKINSSLDNQIEEIEAGVFEFTSAEGKRWEDMIHLNQLYGRAYYTQNNKIDIITDGRQLFDAMVEDIRNAKETINIMFFIIKNDEVGKHFINILTEKAREGVKVRLLMDSMGSGQINDKVLRNFINAGGKRAYFFPKKFNLFNIDFNYRNHRKLAVIDGDIGYIGGFNVAREYLGMKKSLVTGETHI